MKSGSARICRTAYAAWVRYQLLAEITPEVMDTETDGPIIAVASIAAFRSHARSLVHSGLKAGVLGVTLTAAADLYDKVQ
jgi:3-oxoacyl-[acyl-carrier protein] reductase